MDAKTLAGRSCGPRVQTFFGVPPMTATYFRQGAGRSLNARTAEREGKHPLTRAAKAMGISVAAFRAGLANSGIGACEWHHVGKFAMACDYYDTNECGSSYLFWRGAMRGRPAAVKAFRAWLELVRAIAARNAAAALADREAEAARRALAIRLCGEAAVAESETAPFCSKPMTVPLNIRLAGRIVQLGGNLELISAYDPAVYAEFQRLMTNR